MVSRLGASLSFCGEGKGGKGFKSPSNYRLFVRTAGTLVHLPDKKGGVSGYIIRLRNAITVLPS